MTLDGYPGVSSFTDRHGRTRWRFRSRGRTVSLPDVADPGFDAAYQAAIEGRPRRSAEIVPHHGAVVPRSFLAAWRLVLATQEWLDFDEATRSKNTRLAEEFLRSRIAEAEPELWQDMPVADFRRRHAKLIVAAWRETPTKAKHMLTAVRKMIDAAMDAEWIEADPTLKLGFRPKTKGWKAWTQAAMAQYEARWPVGSTPRLVYSVALWLGNRRGDVAALRKDARETKTILIDGEPRDIDGFTITQRKGGGKKTIFMPITPMLAECLDAIAQDGETVIQTAYGNPFSDKSLTGMMAHWTKMASLPPGFTLHGLRKSLGVKLAESDATTRQIMEALGHDDIEHAELYSREASQIRLAVAGMDKVVRMTGRG